MLLIPTVRTRLVRERNYGGNVLVTRLSLLVFLLVVYYASRSTVALENVRRNVVACNSYGFMKRNCIRYFKENVVKGKFRSSRFFDLEIFLFYTFACFFFQNLRETLIIVYCAN